MLQSKVRSAPALDEPPAKVLRRARGRRALNATGVAAVVIVAAVGSLIGVRSLGTSPIEPIVPMPGGVIPWVESSPAAAGKTPSCTAEDLVLTAAPVEAGKLSFVPKHADVHCRLDLGIGLRIRDAAGRDVGLRLDLGQEPDEGLLIANTSRTTDIQVSFTNGCLPAGPHRLDVILPNKGGTLSATTSDNPMACYGTGDQLRATLSFGPGTLRSMGNVADLRVEIEGLPRSIARGQTLQYVVKMSNPTNEAIRFDVCPAFLQILVPDFRRSQESWAEAHNLNCRAISDAIPAHRSLLFAMEYKVRADAAPGSAQLKWLFGNEVPGNPLDTGTVLITE